MKTIYLLGLFLFFAGIVMADNDLERTFKLASGKEIRVDLNSGGSIEVRGWEKNEVSVKARSGGDIDDYRFDFDERSSGIAIDVDHSGYGRHHGDIRLILQVPRESDLELETMGGEIVIDNIEGNIEGETMGGEIELSNLKGTIEMTTMGGDILVAKSHLDGEVKTMGGEIEFRDVTGNLNGSTMGGNVKYTGKQGKSPATGNKETRISTMGGDIKVDDAPGGANVSTMGGDIHIRRAGKYVKAKTMGGEIELDAVDGGVKASTMGGDVTVVMVGDPNAGERDVDLSSMGGDITLTVPAGLSMSFDLKLTYTKRSSGEHKIISDFPVKIDETDEWDYGNGSPRKYIYGTGKVAGGKFKIKIETINGNIIIRKGK